MASLLKRKMSKNFWSKLRLPKSKKALQLYIGFLNYHGNYIPLSPFFKLLNETTKFYVHTNLVDDFTNLNKVFDNSCQFALRQLLEDKPLVVMSDASFTVAGLAILIQTKNYNPNAKHTHL